MKSNRSKACDISNNVKNIVWERDHKRCIFCGSHRAMPNAHYIPRSAGGLGIEQNIVTACIQCHQNLDQTTQRKEMFKYVESYLSKLYPDFTDEERKYKK